MPQRRLGTHCRRASRKKMVLSLKNIPGLDAIVEEEGGGVRIGSLATVAQLASDPILSQRNSALVSAAQSSASLQIRNVATLGGNLLQRPRCWYFRRAEYHCSRRGGNHCFAMLGENQ